MHRFVLKCAFTQDRWFTARFVFRAEYGGGKKTACDSRTGGLQEGTAGIGLA